MSGCSEDRRFFAVASSTRKIGMVIFQRRRLIVPLIELGRIFFNKLPSPSFVAEKAHWRINSSNNRYKRPRRASGAAHEARAKVDKEVPS